MKIPLGLNSGSGLARVKTFLAFIFILILIAPLDAQENSGDIEITVTGFRGSSGAAGYALFTTEKGFPMKSGLAAERGFANIVQSSCTLSFKSQPYGKYAVSVFHDENSNQKLDLNALGIPKEGIGVSNDAKGRFGPPKYKDSSFILLSTTTRLVISITYRGR